MSSAKIFYGCLFLLVLFTARSWACLKRNPQDEKPNDDDKPATGSSSSSSGTIINACCQCGQAISVSILVSNQIQEPHFEFTTEMKDRPQRELIHFVQEASTQDKRFRFTAQHYGSMGFAITTINNLEASVVNETYWHISTHYGSNSSPRSLPLGVSSYIPANMETIMFNFTSYATPDNH